MKMNDSKRFSMWSLVAAASLVLSVLLSGHQVSGYGAGADPSVCKSMIPSHGPEPQTGPNPFKLVVSKTSLQGFETVDITLTSISGNEEFKGFLIQVRKVANGTNEEEVKTYGEFSGDTENARTLDCFGLKKSAMTHPSGDLKKSITVHWIAPNDEDAEYQIYFSVVAEVYSKYWTHIPHEEKLRVTRDAAAKTTAAPIIAASPELLEKWRDAYKGCGENKGCFGMPGDCVEKFDAASSEPTTCDIMVTWEAKGDDKYEFILTGRPGGNTGYVAVGFSDDKSMGSDSVVGCANLGQETLVQRYHNPARSNVLHSDPRLALQPGATASLEGNLFCTFTQSRNHTIGDQEVDFKEKNYYLLLSKTPSADANSLHQHRNPEDKGVAPRSVHMTDNIIMGATTHTWLMQLHGSLMVIAWLMCASTGMFTARYFKLTHTDFMPCGKAFWFALHLCCMATTAFFTICGAILIVIMKKGFDFEQTHAILGIIVVILAILQVIIAFFRPHPGTRKRPIFNWIHWGIGNSAHIVGIACIFLAVELSLADLARFSENGLWQWILLGLVLFHVLMHIVMSIHTLWADKQMESNNKKRALTPGPMKPNGMSTEAPGTAFRSFMLGLYLIVMAAGAIALVCLIFWPKNKKEDQTS